LRLTIEVRTRGIRIQNLKMQKQKMHVEPKMSDKFQHKEHNVPYYLIFSKKHKKLDHQIQRER